VSCDWPANSLRTQLYLCVPTARNSRPTCSSCCARKVALHIRFGRGDERVLALLLKHGRFTCSFLLTVAAQSLLPQSPTLPNLMISWVRDDSAVKISVDFTSPRFDILARQNGCAVFSLAVDTVSSGTGRVVFSCYLDARLV
jgi:hypothetical protein